MDERCIMKNQCCITRNECCTVWDSISISEGNLADFYALAAFHYRSHRVGGAKRVFVARYRGPGLGGSAAHDGMIAGVLVEALPALGCTLRSLALRGRFGSGNRQLDAARLNREVRTISRVVVHPMFRGVGLGVELVRFALAHAETNYVEALAAMGKVNPFFEKAGMKKYERPAGKEAVRLIAALVREGLRAEDLVDASRVKRSAFLEAELWRFCRRGGTFEEMVAEARGRVMSWPVYYLWASSSCV